MVLMDVSRARRPDRSPGGLVPVREDAAMDELEALYWTFDLNEQYRVELLAGQIVVSPMSVVWHGRAVMWLLRQLDPACLANGWDQSPGSNLRLPPTRDIIVPDQVVFKNPDAASPGAVVPIEHVLLVAEVCSPSTRQADRQVKPLSCAKAGIPLYVLVDRFTDPMSVTLYSEPGEEGYAKAEKVAAGPDGGTLHIPAPFGLTLDASTLLRA
jgi:Uma2 family endonuclease